MFSKAAPRVRQTVQTLLALACSAAAFASISAVSSSPVLSRLSPIGLAHAADPDQGPNANNDLPEGKSLMDMITGKADNWQEMPVASLPPLPLDKNLLPFQVSAQADLTFLIDKTSISVGKDGVVRYTVEVKSPAGARNIRYEGIRCANYSWRLYSGTNSDGTAWDNASTDWMRIQQNPMNGYQDALYNDYFCSNKSPVSSVKQIVEYIRYNRSLRTNDYRN
ncbi:CNP1-like family protein [Robbsia sp. KACC 23696]|uniref:CNP1-like family protein n=1 Tax=Robbsia sp. KACC 23696 TaxID=3149231 RepID=UPI00325C2FA5